MPVDYALALALVQGATEFLPVSSSAHLVLLARVAGRANDITLITAAHLGSLVAALVYFRRDFRSLLTPPRLSVLAIASAPALLVGAVIVGLFGATRLPDALALMAWANIIFACLLFAADRWGAEDNPLGAMTRRRAFLIGCAQVLAFVPGASRMGVVLTAARGLGFERTDAARFGLWLSLPVILAAALAGYGQASVASAGALGDALLVSALAFVAALFALAGFMGLVRRVSLLPFVVYRLLLGVVLLALA